ncbi:MAG: hypothetical protein HW376_863 [candidate division NC10 bacterium]|nr:hypothetical protein [candidate division NC10 bacterium]
MGGIVAQICPRELGQREKGQVTIWLSLAQSIPARLPNGLELSCPAETGNPTSLYTEPASRTITAEGPARRVSFSALLGGSLPGAQRCDSLSALE